MSKKFNTEICDSKMTFDECELAILRHAIDETTEIQGKEKVNNADIKKMIIILENFLIRKKQICYGGTAINNILPKSEQFYNKEFEIPDYDFFSKTALADAKELADIYYSEGFNNVEAKSGVHKGTYKVFVNFIPIADITYIHSDIYDNLEKETITVMGIKYCPPNYLRMSMYLELSRPAGDVSRWEKVLKRLTLLNKHFPLKSEINCKKVSNTEIEENMKDDIFTIIKNTFIDQEVVFFGGYASYLYSRYMPKHIKNNFKIPEFDVLVEEAKNCALIIKDHLNDAGIKNIEIIEYKGIEDIIPKHFQIKVNNKSYAYIYEPIACHNYNTIEINNKKVNVATIDTMLSFYLAFIYTNDENYDKERILCLAKYLYEVEQHNKLEQKGILKRFSTTCIGTQKSLSGIRSEKSEMFKKLSNKRESKQYEEWFLKYVPEQLSIMEKKKKKKKLKKYIENDTKIFKQQMGIDDSIEQEKKEEEEQGTVKNMKKEMRYKESDYIVSNKEKYKKRFSRNFFKKTKKNKKSLFDTFFTRKTKKGFLF